jgi:hypothetical protein
MCRARTSKPRRENRITGVHPTNRIEQFFTRDGLGDVTTRTRADNADYIVGCVGDRQCEALRVWKAVGEAMAVAARRSFQDVDGASHDEHDRPE